MTEEQIERRVESYMNSADRSLMNGTMSQIEYNKHVKAIDRWAEIKLRKALPSSDGQEMTDPFQHQMS